MLGATALTVLLAAAIYLVLSDRVTALHTGGHATANTHGRARTSGSAAARRGAAGGSVADVARSPLGLPLGRPPFSVHLAADGAADPIHPAFSEAPHAGILFDLDSGRVLWQLHPRARLRIASLTKMMTALLAVRSGPPDSPVLVTRQAVDAEGSKVGELPLGKHVRLETMLYGLLLPSGNDAAIAIAQHVAGSVHRFVAEMNAQAAKLGLGCTRYSSPSGYYNTHNYSCAADLAELAHIDLQQPRIARITRTYSAILPFPIKGGKLYLYNNNPLLIYGYPGTTGMKTGETIEAGRCLVATAERHGVRLGVVLLHSPAPGTQARTLLNDAFEQIYHQRPVPEPAMPSDA
jgi:serine-type D-Ala-D-Ala carboxypeptidase (penicillin-binding protein 5/6)